MVLLRYSAHEFILKSFMAQYFAPLVLVNITFGHIGCVYSPVHVNDTDNQNIQEMILMGSSLMRKYSLVCGGRRGVEMCVRVSYERLKSFDR